MSEPSLQSEELARTLEQARRQVLSWLRAPQRDPQFLAAEPPPDLVRLNETIAHRFLDCIRDTGFECQVVEMTGAGKPSYEARWTHRGSTFVGFKQPPPEDSPENALLAGCAALLENRWCRARLPE